MYTYTCDFVVPGFTSVWIPSLEDLLVGGRRWEIQQTYNCWPTRPKPPWQDCSEEKTALRCLMDMLNWHVSWSAFILQAAWASSKTALPWQDHRRVAYSYLGLNSYYSGTQRLPSGLEPTLMTVSKTRMKTVWVLMSHSHYIHLEEYYYYYYCHNSGGFRDIFHVFSRDNFAIYCKSFMPCKEASGYQKSMFTSARVHLHK